MYQLFAQTFRAQHMVAWTRMSLWLYRQRVFLASYCSVAGYLRSCHCEACLAGRGNLITKQQRLLRFARNDTHHLISDKALHCHRILCVGVEKNRKTGQFIVARNAALPPLLRGSQSTKLGGDSANACQQPKPIGFRENGHFLQKIGTVFASVGQTYTRRLSTCDVATFYPYLLFLQDLTQACAYLNRARWAIVL